MTDLLALLANREYKKYITSSLLAATGSGMYFVAISWYLYKSSDSAMTIACTFIISSLPGLLFSPWIGAFVDRWNVRRICAITDFVRAALLAFVVVEMYLKVLNINTVYVTTFLLALCENFFQPAVCALIRDVAPKERLLEANIASNMSMQIGTLAGAGVSGFLVGAIETHWVIAVNVVSFLGSAFLTLWIRHNAAIQEADTAAPEIGAIREFCDALRYAKESGFILSLAIEQMLVYVTLFLCNTLLPAFVDRSLAAGAKGFGLIDAAWGAGALFGGMSLSYVTRKIKAEWFGIAGSVLLACFLIVFLSSHQIGQAAMAYFILGGLAVMIRVNSDTTLATLVTPSHFGKIKAAISMLIAYMSLAVYAGVGYLGDNVSVRWIYLALSGAIFLVVLLQVLHRLLNDMRASVRARE